MGLPGGMELILIIGILVLLFGAKKIPELAKGIGTGIKEFKKATKDEEKESKKIEDSDKKADS